MKRMLTATAIAFAALTAPALAQADQTAQVRDNVETSVQVTQQWTRGESGFLVPETYKAVHEERIQRIFDEIRAERGPGLTD